MAQNRNLRFDFRGNISSVHKNLTNAISNINTGIRDNLNRSINLNLTNGNGHNQCDLQWYRQVRLINTFVIYDLNNYIMRDIWGEGLNFHAIKFLAIENLETNLDHKVKYLNYTFKRERGVIGPSGFRILGEPAGAGISVQSSSQSEEEGRLILSTNGDVLFNLILIGSSEEQSSSSGN